MGSRGRVQLAPLERSGNQEIVVRCASAAEIGVPEHEVDGECWENGEGSRRAEDDLRSNDKCWGNDEGSRRAEDDLRSNDKCWGNDEGSRRAEDDLGSNDKWGRGFGKRDRAEGQAGPWSVVLKPLRKGNFVYHSHLMSLKESSPHLFPNFPRKGGLVKKHTGFWRNNSLGAIKAEEERLFARQQWLAQKQQFASEQAERLKSAEQEQLDNRVKRENQRKERKERLRKLRSVSIVHMQRILRGHLGRQRCRAIYARRKRAVARIESSYFNAKACRSDKQILTHLRSNRSAIKIQGVVRQRNARRKALALRAAEERRLVGQILELQRSSALVIQKVYRGRLSREQTRPLLLTAQRKKAALAEEVRAKEEARRQAKMQQEQENRMRLLGSSAMDADNSNKKKTKKTKRKKKSSK